MSDELDDINEPFYDDKTLIALVRKDIKYIRKNVCEIKLALEKNYVTKAEFTPVRRLVYGTIGVILTGFVTVLTFMVMGGMVVLK
jgi:hypothetical protein